VNHILVDSSVWIAFFRGSLPRDGIFNLIDANQICTNDLILSEIVPALLMKKERSLVDTLTRLDRSPLSIEWQEIISYQVKNLQKGIHKVGIADLIIMQNVIQKNLMLFTLDTHFKLMSDVFPLKLYDG
jgi:predicted nucleic acid-binding protein